MSSEQSLYAARLRELAEQFDRLANADPETWPYFQPKSERAETDQAIRDAGAAAIEAGRAGWLDAIDNAAELVNLSDDDVDGLAVGPAYVLNMLIGGPAPEWIRDDGQPPQVTRTDTFGGLLGEQYPGLIGTDRVYSQRANGWPLLPAHERERIHRAADLAQRRRYAQGCRLLARFIEQARDDGPRASPSDEDSLAECDSQDLVVLQVLVDAGIRLNLTQIATRTNERQGPRDRGTVSDRIHALQRRGLVDYQKGNGAKATREAREALTGKLSP